MEVCEPLSDDATNPPIAEPLWQDDAMDWEPTTTVYVEDPMDIDTDEVAAVIVTTDDQTSAGSPAFVAPPTTPTKAEPEELVDEVISTRTPTTLR